MSSSRRMIENSLPLVLNSDCTDLENENIVAQLIVGTEKYDFAKRKLYRMCPIMGLRPREELAGKAWKASDTVCE